ncbi:MAG: hypothetical protein IT367_21075 [Candidatus Hydrogenedentes bacterium]|nr:hypothetical protein [Candidatus Hydrogenedentota bacterium]
MWYAKSAVKALVLLFLALTSVSCPPGSVGTFKVYIINLSTSTIDYVAMKDQDTGMYEAIADDDVVGSTMVELNVSKNKYQTNSGSLQVNVAGVVNITLNGRVLGPNPVVFYFKGVTDAGLISYELG